MGKLSGRHAFKELLVENGIHLDDATLDRALDVYKRQIDSLNAALAAVKNIADLDNKAENLSSRLQSIFFEAEDVSRELIAYRDRVDLDAYRLEDCLLYTSRCV